MTGLLNANGGIAVNTDKFTVAANGNTVTKGSLKLTVQVQLRWVEHLE